MNEVVAKHEYLIFDIFDFLHYRRHGGGEISPEAEERGLSLIVDRSEVRLDLDDYAVVNCYRIRAWC